MKSVRKEVLILPEERWWDRVPLVNIHWGTWSILARINNHRNLRDRVSLALERRSWARR